MTERFEMVDELLILRQTYFDKLSNLLSIWIRTPHTTDIQAKTSLFRPKHQ